LLSALLVMLRTWIVANIWPEASQA